MLVNTEIISSQSMGVQIILELRASVIIFVSVRRTQLMSSTYNKGNRHVSCLQEENVSSNQVLCITYLIVLLVF